MHSWEPPIKPAYAVQDCSVSFQAIKKVVTGLARDSFADRDILRKVGN